MVQKFWNKLLVIFSAGQGQAKKPGFSSLRGGNRKTLHGLIIIMVGLLTSINVNALTCSNGTNSQAYYNSGTWTNILAVNNEQDIPTSSTRLIIAQTNTNIKNSNLSYTIRTEMKAVGNFTSNPTIEVRYGTSSSYINIASQCSIRWTRSYEYNDNIVTKTIWNNELVCNYQGANENANYIAVVYEINNQPINKIRMTSRCLIINPNDTEQIINNDNNNTNEIRNEMYEYYDSLWEKSNVQEQNILDAIEEATEVTPHDEFTTDNTKAEEIEDKEGDLLDLLEDGPTGQLTLNTGLNTPDYTNGLQVIWRIINGTIGNYSWLWPLTMILLSFGIIKLILSR